MANKPIGLVVQRLIPRESVTFPTPAERIDWRQAVTKTITVAEDGHVMTDIEVARAKRKAAVKKFFRRLIGR